MNQSDVSTGEQLSAQLALQEIRERAQLWNVAEGRFGWRGSFTGICSILVLIIGLALRIYENGLAGFMGKNPSSYFIVMGMGLLGLTMWGNTQRQLSALRELVKNLERDRL